ncbi:DNA-binding protein Ikaros-like isoform X4 [Synchiropus splendidus]|uniref:DNA-binding protein Ikaros-like isoform X4 n=1 Tax=Synchiropus splendidus TaxID=270530 RepID=UPI00237D7038|nr:DNA-binding protein Ikaros-like isoform X4 [Synchiropus splendidus]
MNGEEYSGTESPKSPEMWTNGADVKPLEEDDEQDEQSYSDTKITIKDELEETENQEMSNTDEKETLEVAEREGGSEDELDEDERMEEERDEDEGGERPFHCSQCGASFTQKGNLLRHIKLHSGEKPFKCPMCSYACRRRDALSGHLRTHSVEKPFKCNHCSRSYKQRSSLEEHRDRCHVYMQCKAAPEPDLGHASRAHMGSERALLLDKLASNVAKRKSTMPQKFTGDNSVCLDLSFNKPPAQQGDVNEPNSPLPDAQHQPSVLSGVNSDSISSHRVYMNQNDIHHMTNGHKMGLHGAQPHLSMESFRANGSQPVLYSLGNLLGGVNHQNGLPQSQNQHLPLPFMEASRGEVGGLQGAVFPCSHCRVIFLDYVMFTIHMGCHGFRDPLECNVCGHRSRDRYEFSSHIVRGEHRLDLK